MKKLSKLKIPNHVVKHYNEIQSEIARITKRPFYHILLQNGEYLKVKINHRKYTIGADWSPKEYKGTIVITYNDVDKTIIESTIQVTSENKYDFDRIVNTLTIEYESNTIKEI